METDCRQPIELKIVGTLPDGIEGTLYRNGPANFSGARHLFDGYGMVGKVAVRKGKATYQSAFVETDSYKREKAAKRTLFGGFGATPPHGLLGVLRGFSSKDPANVNVIFWNERLYALSDVGVPHEMDPISLKTLGPDTLGQRLPLRGGFCAHPKLHRPTGDLWAFSVKYGPASTLQIFQISPDRQGNASVTKKGPGQQAPRFCVDMPFPSVIHDFALTATKAVFMFVPYCVERFPWKLLLGLVAPVDVMHWLPELGTTVVTIDLKTGEQQWASTTAIFALHHVNAFDNPDGSVTLDTCAHPDPEVIDLVSNSDSDIGIRAKLRRLVVRHGEIIDTPLADAVLEFPRLAPQLRGVPHRTVFGLTLRPGSARETAIVKIELPDEEHPEARISSPPMRPGETVRECIPVPKANAQDLNHDVWLWAFVKIAANNTTELRILDGENPALGPVCTMVLPQNFPADIHGVFVRLGSVEPSID